MNKLYEKTYTTRQLVNMRLSCLPKSQQGIDLVSKAGNWPFIEHKGRGRLGLVKHYLFKGLPTAVQQEIKQRAMDAIIGKPEKKQVVNRQLDLSLTTKQQTVEGARKGVLLAIERIMAGCGVSREAAMTTLLTRARMGELEPQLDNMLCAARDGRGRKSDNLYPSIRTLKKWLAQDKTGNLAPLPSKYKDMSVPVWAKNFLECYQRPEKPSVELAYRHFLSLWMNTQPLAKTPSIHQVRRFLAKMGNVSREVGRMGTREIKNIKPFIRRDFSELLPCDIYSADGHTFDAEVQHPVHGRPFRPEITTVIDIATRRVIGWSIDLAESSLAVLDALRNACKTGGLPAVFYVDNGSGYKNDMMRNEATGFMGRLGITMTNSLPYNSQARGVIERLHQTIWVDLAKQLPGYMGHEMDRQAKLESFKLSRKAIQQNDNAAVMPLLSWVQFMDIAAQAVAAYNARPHRSLLKITDETGLRRNMTPNEVWQQHCNNGWEPMLITDDESNPLFRPQALRTVRRCEVSLFGNIYFSKQLEEFHGEQLPIGYDIHDANKVWVYTDDGRFICTADWNANRRDYMPKAFVEQARDKRAAGREKRLTNQLQEVREERNGGLLITEQDVIEIPGVVKTTRAELAEQEIPLTIVKKAQSMPQPETQPSKPEVLHLPETPEGRWAHFNLLKNKYEKGEPLTEKEMHWLFNSYNKTNEYRSMSRKFNQV